MKNKRLVVGQLKTNCYLVWEEKNHQALIIDPGDDADFIIRKIQDFQLAPQAIIATHGHFDHVLAIPELKLAFQIPFFIHEADLFLLSRASQTARYFTGVKADPALASDHFLEDGQIIKLGPEKLKVMTTPGHTPGSVCLYTPGTLFTGDLIFADGVGRTDFHYASSKQLQQSLAKIQSLPGNTRLFPGHGRAGFSL